MLSICRNRPRTLSVAVDRSLSKLPGYVPCHALSILALVAAAGVVLPSCAGANTFIVNTAGDPGPMGTLSLRQAITGANASAGNLVQFAPALIGSTITLAGGQIPISKSMTITGPGAEVLTISGNDASRIFYIRPVPDDSVPSHTQVNISGMTLAHGSVGGQGGAICANHSQVLVDQSTIRDSKAFWGGGMYSILGTTTIQHSRLVGNQATYGGAFFSVGDTEANLYFDTISGNSADSQGAGVFVRDTPSALISASTISGNTVLQPTAYTGAQGGGGVAFANIDLNGKAWILNSTVTQNYSYTGGAGVALLDAQSGNAAYIGFSTIVGNVAAVYETGIGITSAGGSVLVNYSILANNFSQTGTDDVAGTFFGRQSLIKSPGGATITGSSIVIGVDPQLGSLRDNGGPTLTMLPAIGSPAIHGVPCTGCVNVGFKDQRGVLRHEPSDIGSVERQYPEDLIFRNAFSPP
jgi:hypothetical protein